MADRDQEAADRRQRRERERNDAREQMASIATEAAERRAQEASQKEADAAAKAAEQAVAMARRMDEFMSRQSARGAGGAEFQPDALRRIGAMRDTGAAQAREPIQLDRERNRKLDQIFQAIRQMKPIDLDGALNLR